MVDARRHVAQQPVARISEKIVRGDSPRHGVGVFAVQPISRGETIIVFTGEVTHASETDFSTYHLQVGEEHYIGPSGELDDFVNHCCDPNSGFSPMSEHYSPTLVARRDIAPGEEITMDYGAIIDEPDWEGFSCGCATSSCRGQVVSFRNLSDVKKQSLKPWVLPYLRDKYFR